MQKMLLMKWKRPCRLMDDYAEIEAKIREMSDDLSYKNRQVAREAEGHVKNPGVIAGQVQVKTIHSDICRKGIQRILLFIWNMYPVYFSLQKNKAHH